jgi:naringenin degradation protein FdeH
VTADVRPVRRVVVGPDASGAAVVQADGPSPHVHTLPGMPADLALVDLWYTSGPGSGGPAADAATADTAARDLAVAPDPGGTLFRVVQFPPDSELPAGPDGGPGLFWHETPTTDFNVVLQGELRLLTERASVTLRAGDTVVVRGGRHAWSNPSGAVARLATVAVHT